MVVPILWVGSEWLIYKTDSATCNELTTAATELEGCQPGGTHIYS